MPDVRTFPMRPARSTFPDTPETFRDSSEMTDDECLIRLAQAVAEHDSDHLDEVARLIGRLVVPIE